MDIDAVSHSPAGSVGSSLSMAARANPLLTSQMEFSKVLGRAQGPAKRGTAMDEAREAAASLISTALVQPVLERMRASNQAAEPFKPTQTERTFGAMLDTKLAQQLTTSGNWPLIDAVASRLLSRNTGTAATPAANEAGNTL